MIKWGGGNPDNPQKSYLYYSRTNLLKHISRLCENVDKKNINPLLSKDYYDGLAEEDFAARCFSQ